MEKIIFTTISVMFFALLTSSAVFAQGMMVNNMMMGNFSTNPVLLGFQLGATEKSTSLS